MIKKNKLLALVLCAGLTAAAFTGCGSKDAEKKEAKTEKTEKASDDPFIKEAASYIDLAEYKTISLKAGDIDEQLQSQIDSVLEGSASYEQVKKGKVKDGDTVNIYYVGKMDGEAFEGGSCTEDSMPSGYDLTIGSHSFIDGFEDALIGKSIGKTYDIDVTFPDPYQNNPDFSGKPAVFTVTLNYKQGKKITPKLTEDFVKEYLPDYESVKDYKAKTRESVVRSMAVEKVCKDTKVKEYPEDNVSRMEKQLKTSIENYLTQNNATLDDYLASLNISEEDYKKQIETTSRQDVANQLVYNAIAQAEDIEISEDEYKKELDTYLANYNCEKESDLDKTFENMYGTTANIIINNELLYNKIADYLAGNVKES